MNKKRKTPKSSKRQVNAIVSQRFRDYLQAGNMLIIYSDGSGEINPEFDVYESHFGFDSLEKLDQKIKAG